jgi:hypothetical protein
MVVVVRREGSAAVIEEAQADAPQKNAQSIRLRQIGSSWEGDQSGLIRSCPGVVAAAATLKISSSPMLRASGPPRVAVAVIHVSQALPSGATAVPGQNRTPDNVIAHWCAQTEHVLVTTDEDFRGRWLRSGLLAAAGVEVITFDHDIPGLRQQHARITKHFPWWEGELCKRPYGHRVWIQRQRNPPTMTKSSARRQRQGRQVQRTTAR